MSRIDTITTTACLIALAVLATIAKAGWL